VPEEDLTLGRNMSHSHTNNVHTRSVVLTDTVLSSAETQRGDQL